MCWLASWRWLALSLSSRNTATHKLIPNAWNYRHAWNFCHAWKYDKCDEYDKCGEYDNSTLGNETAFCCLEEFRQYDKYRAVCYCLTKNVQNMEKEFMLVFTEQLFGGNRKRIVEECATILRNHHLEKTASALLRMGTDAAYAKCRRICGVA